MALEKNKFPLLGDDLKEFKITGGPNDWDLWLCLRETIHEVTFYTDKTFLTPGKGDPRTFIPVKILSLARGRIEWVITGWILGAKLYDTIFKANYSSETRKGTASLTK